MSEMMTFPETWEEFEKSYGFIDSEEVYTNGSRLIPSFRVKQWLDHEESKRETKQQATASSDCIYRKDAIDALKEHRTLYCDNTPDTFSKLSYAEKSRVDELDTAIAILINLPSVESEIIRCRDCKHHDGIRCFRWNSTIITGFDDFCSNAERRIDERLNQQTRCD